MKQKIYYLTCLIFALIHFRSASTQPFGYNYVRELVIEENQIPDGASLSNFPLLVQFTHADLRSVANGGHVENTNGYDILFYLNGCVTKLDHQLESYNPATGALTAWVLIPVLSTTANTSIYMYYGNDTVTTSASTTGVWDTNFLGVWHLADNPGGTAPQMQDGTSNNNHGTTNGGMTMANSITGKMGGALTFDEVNDYVRIPDFLYGQELTVSFWFNLSEVNGNSYQYLFSHGAWATPNSLNVYMGEDNITIPAEIPNRQMLKTNFRDNNDANNFDTLNAGNTYVDGNWHYYTIRIQDFGGATVYIDGTQVVNYAVWGANSFDPATDIFLGGREDLHAQRFYGGAIDEVRISTAWRSSNWISTEYNNQQFPELFVSVRPEGPAVAFCLPLAIRLYDFEAQRISKLVKLTWNLEGQANPVRYTIERSPNGTNWSPIAELYDKKRFIDSFPLKGLSYYRLQYIHEGKTSYSEIRKVSGLNDPAFQTRLYPNPVAGNGRIYIRTDEMEKPFLAELCDALGRVIMKVNINAADEGLLFIDLPGNRQTEILFLRLFFKNRQEYYKVLIR